MESGITNDGTSALAETAEPQNVLNKESEESFQSLIFELFEKNGIINDVRAYLRGHIVEVLKSAQTGDPPQCQKRFTQRLELTYQALNILIAEYLMRLEFSYSLSVFVSEIPLANMVFGFAKALMERIGENNGDVRFKDSDVWSILNYLGVQCDSQHASDIAQMYNNEKQHPLLLCILKCMPMYKDCVGTADCPSDRSVASTKSLDSMEVDSPQNQPECRHYYYCKNCQNKISRLKNKYKKKQKYFAKNVKNKESLSSMKSEGLVKNISSMEKNLIEKIFKNMFEQLKSVYETEIEMLKVEEEKKVKRSMATHEMQLQKKREELEETYKARELELERSVQHKKKFLWGLARSLRDQHQHMTRAMHDVRAETQRLETKEDSLKTQLAEAEKILKKRGEEMRIQISNELAILEGHLESMKREREKITLERAELEALKTREATNSKITKEYKKECEQVHSHYNLLKNELAILKMYVQSSQIQPKCVIERGTVTESIDFELKSNVTLNNSQGNEKCKNEDFDDRVKVNQVVNNFRKKNVNFSQSNIDEIYHESSRDHSQSSISSEAGDTPAVDLDLERSRDRDLIQRLTDENDRLKANARRRWSMAQEPVTPQTQRPRTAPPATQHDVLAYSLTTTASASNMNVGWRKGAGEELSMFSNAQPRILVPGDTLPFIGVLRDTHGHARRPLTSAQTRTGRNRAGALSGVSKHSARHTLGINGQAMRVSGTDFPIASSSLQMEEEETYTPQNDTPQPRGRAALNLQESPEGDKSPRTVLKEAKDKLRSKDSEIPTPQEPKCPRSKSPNTVLREAKQRLRKLEIEAEAVEQSYRHFRRRQSELRLERQARSPSDHLAKALDITRSHSKKELNDTKKDVIGAQLADLQKTIRSDFHTYICEYKNKFDLGETYFRSKPTATERAKPIPATYIPDKEEDNINYLETPLTEFRKLYTSTRDNENKTSAKNISHETNEHYERSSRLDPLRKLKHNKQAELQVLKQNINKMNNLSNNCEYVLLDEQMNQSYMQDENKLVVEVEGISEINDVNETQDMTVVVQSAVNAKEMSGRMTIIVSPKRPGSPEVFSQSPEEVTRLTSNDVLDAIFHANPDNASSVQMELELKDEDSISEYDKDYEYVNDGDNDYPNSPDYDRSPISMSKLPEDDNFWNS